MSSTEIFAAQAPPGRALAPRILSLGTAVPERCYTQEELSRLFGLQNPKIVRLFRQSHIKRRYLCLPEPGPLGMPEETVEELTEKHRSQSLKVGGAAVEAALAQANLQARDIDFLICVTSTGFLCPGVSALLLRQHGFRENVHRLDVVGMGCNAAVNALQPMVSFLRSHPASHGLLVCVENCSSAYVVNDTVGTAVVNSLFGDAAAAVAMGGAATGHGAGSLPTVQEFESHIVVEAMHTMRFDLEKGKLAFHLDRDIPYAIGANCGLPVERLLKKTGLKKRDVAHWIVHSGGKKVIDSVKMNLELSDHDVRHTLHVLENYGNISSCSVLFSLQRLAGEEAARPGDYGVLMAMGPGASIETALLQW